MIPDPRSIDQRSRLANNRERLRDRVVDTVPGKQVTGVLVALAERKSRMYLVRKWMLIELLT